MKLQQKKGFTLLEIIIVIIILGVLAALALPRFFRTVEYSRSSEATGNIQALRGSVERCRLQKGTYTTCSLSNLDVADPTLDPDTHFTYLLSINGTGDGFTILATRNTKSGGVTTSTVNFQYTTTGGTTLTGATAFSNL